MTDGPLLEDPDPTTVRLDFDALVPRFAAALSRLDALAGVGLDPRLRDLVRVRASMINGCAYCVDMHTKDALAGGEEVHRITGTTVWRETDWYTPAERSALELTEAMTVLHEDRVPAAVLAGAARHFAPEPLAQLVALITTINAWNRIGVTTRCWHPGSYEVDTAGQD